MFVMFFFISCSKTSINKKQFPFTQKLEAEFIKIEEIIKFENIYKLNDFVIIRDGNSNNEYFFYVYKYPEFDFLYAFAPKGNGAEEYLMPTVIKSTQNNLFLFRDHATDRFVTYEITDSLSLLINKFDFRPTDDRFMWEINCMNDSLYLLKRSNNKWCRRELWNYSSFSIVDSIPNTFDLVKNMGKDYYTTFDDCWIISSGDKFAFGYFFIDRIEFGSIKNNKIEIEKSIGENSPPDFYLYKKNVVKGKYKYNVDNNIVYYESMCSGYENVYALFSGIPWGDNEKMHSSCIEIYSWDGTPKTLVELDKSISHFIVDEEAKAIYGFDISNTEDVIYKYTYR